MIIKAKIDVTKIDKSAIHVGTKGKYLDVTLLENRDGTDQYGNDFMVVQDIGKERRQAGEKGPILGNAQYVARDNPRPSAPVEDSHEHDDDIPF